MNLVTLEVRWFFEGAIPDDVRRWFDVSLPGPMVDPAPRSDFYLIVPGRDDTGLKLREQKLELKLRSRSAPFASERVGARGTAELWEKWSWFYGRPGDVEAGFLEEPRGPRVDVGKVRWQRKYDASQAPALRPVSGDESLACAVSIEITAISVLDRQAWTLGFDTIGPASDLDGVLARAVDRLLEAFPATPTLTTERSFGYPRWLMRQLEGR
jgi:hypothetical protein